MAAPGMISNSCVVGVLHAYVLGLPVTFGQKRHSFEPPGAHKWHLGRFILWVRVSIFRRSLVAIALCRNSGVQTSTIDALCMYMRLRGPFSLRGGIKRSSAVAGIP